MRSTVTLLSLAFLGCGAHPTTEPDGPTSSDGDSAVAEHGLRGVYYTVDGARGAERIDDTVDFAWGTTEPAPGVGADRFTVRWTGTLQVPSDGMYGFSLDADDGVRLWIGGSLVIDAWSIGAHAPTLTTVPLTAGSAPIKVTYFDRSAAAHVTLRWHRPDGTDEIVPRDVLSAAAPDPALLAPAPPYENTVDEGGCADPGALAFGGSYYLACTGGRFRIKRSHDLVNWTSTASYILPAAGAPWSGTADYRWAPEMHPVGTKIVAYFVSADASGQRAIGAAVANDPLGPYTVQPTPLVTNPIGVIDPSFFHDDDGKNYLVWKVAGNSSGQPTPIFLRELKPDGLSFAAGSAPIELIRNDASTWEGPLVEAPWLVKRNGMYYLFYSGNFFDEHYRVGVARAASVRGPYTKHGAPILGNNAKWLGPGHNSIVTTDSIDYIVYHAWAAKAGAPDQTRGRLLMVDRIAWANGWPTIDGDGTPSMTARPQPGLDPDLP